jgi:signal transduction histidine kinase
VTLLGRGRTLVVDAVIATVVFGLALAVISSGHFAGSGTPRPLDALGVVLAALASLPLAARRLAPFSVFLVVGAATATLYGLDYPLGPPAGSVVAMYTLAERRDTVRVSGRVLGVAVLAVFAALAGVHFVHHDFPAAELVLGAIVWGGAWVAGERTRLRRERIAALEDRAAKAEREAERERRLAAVEERARIARELHDSAGHAINVILVQAGAARLLQERDPARSRAALETLEDVARDTLDEIDALVRALREEEDSPGATAPLPGIDALETLTARHRATGLDVTTRVRGTRPPLARSVDLAAYRIVQEALTNAARHGTGPADVEVAYGSHGLELTITNPATPNGSTASGGHGLVGMRERATLLGGSLDAGQRNGSFRVHARLPCTREDG